MPRLCRQALSLLRGPAVSTNRLRYHVGNQGVSRQPSFCRCGGVAGSLLRATHGLLHCGGTGVPWVSLPGTHQCALRCPSRMASGAEAPTLCVPSVRPPVVLSSFANVFVILVFCDVLEYLHPLLEDKRCLCELIIVSNCLTLDFICLLITSCSLTVRLLTFSAPAVVLARAFCLVCCRALAFLSATSFAASFAAIVLASSTAWNC